MKNAHYLKPTSRVGFPPNFSFFAHFCQCIAPKDEPSLLKCLFVSAKLRDFWEALPLPSTRLTVWVALGAIWWIAASVIGEFRVVALLYNLILLLIALLDLALSPGPRAFEIEREVEPKMNLGVANAVTLHAHSRAARAVQLTVRDEPPAAWPVTTPDIQRETTPEAALPGMAAPPVARVILHLPAMRGVVPPDASAVYHVTPVRRGDYAFGALSARYATVLGLWQRQFRRSAPLKVRVYPDTSEVRRYELRLRQGRLRDLGLHLTRFRGSGTEFESLRDYSRDDEFKSINWKASARQGRLIATDFEIERDQTIIIALDCGRMMTAMATVRRDEGGGMRDEDSSAISSLIPHPSSLTLLSKLDCAINATVLLAHVSASMGDAVGVLLFSDTVLRWLPPRKGRGQTGAIIEALYAAQPSLVEPDYAAAYEYLLTRRMRRALVVTFTDLIDPDASRELLGASAALRRHHHPLCVTINNRDVMDLAATLPHDTGQLYGKAMAQKMLRQHGGALEALRHHGVGILDVEASQLTVATVNRYLDLKSRGAL